MVFAIHSPELAPTRRKRGERQHRVILHNHLQKLPSPRSIFPIGENFDGGGPTQTVISMSTHGNPRIISPGHYRLMLIPPSKTGRGGWDSNPCIYVLPKRMCSTTS